MAQMDRDLFVGTWKLVTAEYRSDDDEVHHLLGTHPIGQLMYDERGYMSAQLLDADRPVFASNDWLKGTPEEVAAAFKGHRAYFGTFEVDEKAGTVTHHVLGSSFPNWIGTDNVRYYEFVGKRLILKTSPMLMGGRHVIGWLVWERAE
jgi:hypothetical protein